ncbi:MAG: bis(5'-nucleosyl)-tetraphosphatase [Lachnospiraceae bacterium]
MEIEKIDEKSCGAVLYKMTAEGVRYLIVESASGHISFSKGHVESGESEWETACREIEEETGIVKLKRIDGFRESFVCVTETGNHKEIVYFLANFTDDTIYLQDGELVRYWMLPFKEACALINTEEEKEILQKADKFLGKQM